MLLFDPVIVSLTLLAFEYANEAARILYTILFLALGLGLYIVSLLEEESTWIGLKICNICCCYLRE